MVFLIGIYLISNRGCVCYLDRGLDIFKYKLIFPSLIRPIPYSVSHDLLQSQYDCYIGLWRRHFGKVRPSAPKFWQSTICRAEIDKCTIVIKCHFVLFCLLASAWSQPSNSYPGGKSVVSTILDISSYTVVLLFFAVNLWQLPPFLGKS